jgi:hypothetical protein
MIPRDAAVSMLPRMQKLGSPDPRVPRRARPDRGVGAHPVEVNYGVVEV